MIYIKVEVIGVIVQKMKASVADVADECLYVLLSYALVNSIIAKIKMRARLLIYYES